MLVEHNMRRHTVDFFSLVPSSFGAQDIDVRTSTYTRFLGSEKVYCKDNVERVWGKYAMLERGTADNRRFIEERKAAVEQIEDVGGPSFFHPDLAKSKPHSVERQISRGLATFKAR